MKSIALISLLCASQLLFAQTIRTADNNPTKPTGPNIFPTLQAAINAAAPGDIVYVQPSTANYGDVTIDHPITLRGIGFNTGKDLELSSTLTSITLTNTVSNSTNANGTIIEGLNITNFINLGVQTGTFTFTLQNILISNCQVAWIGRSKNNVPAQNITIQKCNVYSGISMIDTNISQLLIYGNAFSGVFSFGTGCNPFGCEGESGTLSSTIISNNIFGQSITLNFPGVNISALAITNNIFIGGTDKAGSRFISGQLTDAIVSNNIFYGTTPSSSGTPFERNSFLNNISYGTSNDVLPPIGSGVGNTGSGNQISVDPKFVNAAYGSVWAGTMNFSLQSGSPAKNAGTDGTDIGITGGAYPITGGNFKLGTPHAPIIMTLNPAAIIPQNQPILTNIKAKSN